VIVVDNASSDGSPEAVAGKFPWVQLLQTGANLGLARGNNVGIARSRIHGLGLRNDGFVWEEIMRKNGLTLEESLFVCLKDSSASGQMDGVK
jgi:GT2 family glycosyltransferase